MVQNQMDDAVFEGRLAEDSVFFPIWVFNVMPKSEIILGAKFQMMDPDDGGPAGRRRTLS